MGLASERGWGWIYAKGRNLAYKIFWFLHSHLRNHAYKFFFCILILETMPIIFLHIEILSLSFCISAYRNHDHRYSALLYIHAIRQTIICLIIINFILDIMPIGILHFCNRLKTITLRNHAYRSNQLNQFLYSISKFKIWV